TYMKGDVNGNNKIDAADYLMIMDSILGKYKMNETQKKHGDVNGNYKVDAADYLMIMDSILGKIKI
ncbi:MAG: dockerin type I repeat-containing protein, partial [Longicatena sp.]